ncbi:hypothetical protein AB0M12_02090 [Nocardia vinacea]|uniref:hypothetical protein n=1 Tax=Nocardia vinacea TaxID=96468 RepID=UPI003425211E
MDEIVVGIGELEPADPPHPTCGPDCLAHARAATPPMNWMDLLDRQLLLISSKHWTAKTTANFGAALAIITLAFVGVVLTLGWVCGPTSAVITGATGLAGAVGAGAVARKFARQHQQHLASGSPPPPQSEQVEPDVGTPRAA